VLAESGFITQYLSEHFGQDTTMMPKRWKEGREGQVGGETEEWLRWQYFLHFVEGSLMPILTVAMILGIMKGPRVPFFIRPVTAMVANRVFSSFVFPNIQSLLGFLEKQLETSEGDFLCGKHLTSADVLISFALVSAKDKVRKPGMRHMNTSLRASKIQLTIRVLQIAEFGSWPSGDPKVSLPKLYAYIDRLESEPGYKKSVEKIKEIDSSLGVDFKRF